MRPLSCVTPEPTPALPRARGREGPASAAGWGLAGSLLLNDLAFFSLDRLLGGRIYPPGIQSDCVFRCDGRSPVLVPIRHTKGRDVIMRDYIISILQYPIERARVGDKARPIGRLDQLLDQRIDDLALDAEHVLASLLVCGDRPEIVAQLIPRRLRCAERDDRHIVVEGLHPLFVLRGIDGAHTGVDAHPFEVLLDRESNAFEFRLDQEDLKLEGLTGLVVDELFAFEGPTRLLQKLQRRTQPVTNVARTVIFWRVVFCREHLLGDPPMKFFEDF